MRLLLRQIVTTVLSMVLVFSVVIGAITTTACPKDTAVRKAARASYELSGITRDVIAAVNRAYDENIVGVNTKNAIADKLIIISKGGARFNQLAMAANNSNTSNSNGGSVNLATLATLNKILSEEIAGPFLEILDALKIVSPGQALYLHAALGALRTAILTISSVIADNADSFDRIDELMLERVREARV